MTTDAMRVSRDGLQGRVLEFWEWVLRLGRRAPRRLRLCESLPLGERRFVAVVEFEAERFLVGGTPSSMVLLSRLADCRRQEDGSAPEATLKLHTGKLQVEKLQTGTASGDAANQNPTDEKRAPC
jgi:flagellar biogenesis protein FliO